MLNNFRLLTEKEILGDKKYNKTRLSMFNRYGEDEPHEILMCAALDLVHRYAPEHRNNVSHIKCSDGVREITYPWVLAYKEDYESYPYIDHFGMYSDYGVSWFNEYFGIRPAIEYSKIKPYAKDHGVDKKGNKLVTFGTWASKKFDYDDTNVLEKLYAKGEMKELGFYPFCITSDFNYGHYLFEYNGNKYSRGCSSRFLLKNKPVWANVKPVVWLVDEKKNVAIAEKCIFASTYPALEKTKKYLNEEFASDLLAGTEYENTQIGDAYGLKEVEEELASIQSKKAIYEEYPIVMQYRDLIKLSIALCEDVSSEEELNELNKEIKQVKREISKLSKNNDKVRKYINLVCRELELKNKREEYLHPEEIKEKVYQKIMQLRSEE